MDAKSIACFIAVYEEHNMRKAAERLFVTQQGVSRIIIGLEKELGCELFERKRAGLEPTREGVLLYSTAVRMKSEMTEFRQEISNLRQGRSRIRLVSSYDGIYFLYPEIKQFRNGHPGIELSWNEHSDEECFRQLDSGEADLGIILLGKSDASYRSEILLRKQACILVKTGHPLYNKNIVSIEELRNQQIITFGNSQQMFDQFRQRCIEKGFYPEMGTAIEGVGMLYSMVSADEGIGIISENLSSLIAFQGIKAIPIDMNDITIDYYIVRRESKKDDPDLLELWDYLIEVSASHRA